MANTLPTCSLDKLVPDRCDMDTRNDPPLRPISLSKSNNKSRPRLSAWVTPWFLPPVTLPAMSVTKVKLRVIPWSSSFGRAPNQSPNKCPRGRASWKGRRLTETCELSLLQPPKKPVGVFVDCKSPAVTPEFTFVVATQGIADCSGGSWARAAASQRNCTGITARNLEVKFFKQE